MNQGKLQAFRDIFTAFVLLSLCRILPFLETKEQCVLHIIPFSCLLFFALQVRSSQILAAVLVLLAVCVQSWHLSAHSDYQDRVLIELLLGQVLLLSVGLIPSGLVLWTIAALLLCFWPVDKAFPRVVELVSLLTVPICSTLLQGSTEPTLDISEAKVHHCLKLVLQQLRVPLQLALHEGEDAGHRLRQLWQLLTGLDQQLEAQFTSSVLQSTWKQTSAEKADLSCLAKAAAWWQPCESKGSKGSKVLPESLSASPRSPCSQRKEVRETGLLEVSTSIGSMTQWEVLPDGVRMELEIDLERESMRVTEVKFYLPQEERDAFHLKSLFAEEDYENFRNWLEPEVNRSMHGAAIGESTSCAMRLPIGGRVNGILAVDGLNGLRLRCSMTQMSVDKS